MCQKNWTKSQDLGLVKEAVRRKERMDTDHDGQEVCEHSALEVLTKTQGHTNTCAKTKGKK